MMDLNDFLIKERLRAKPRFNKEISRTTLYRCSCDNCGKDRGYLPKSRYKSKPLCVKCATNTDSHKEKLKASHWSKTKSFSPKKHITVEQIKQKRERELECVREYWKTYYKNNKNKIFEKRKNRLKNNVCAKIAANLRTRVRNSIIGGYKSGSAVRDLGCSIQEFKLYLESKFQPGMTWDNYGINGWHIDHIIPLSSFNLSDPNQLKKACHYTNLQPLWAKDNIRKSDKLPDYMCSII